jgi:superfamily I DNA and/or RNA helicase
VVTANLLQKVPARELDHGAERAVGPEWLSCETNFQRRFTPVKGLLSRAGDSILSAKPCFMMSPLSLAKFAKPGHLEFNIVVVDEASQMKPEEALGALLRTKQLVVVGDANQLPPTNFFNRSADNVNPDDDLKTSIMNRS